MRLKIIEAAPITTKEYGYTHRIEVDDSLNTDEIGVWLTVNNVSYSRVSYNVYYLGSKDSMAFILRWG